MVTPRVALSDCICSDMGPHYETPGCHRQPRQDGPEQVGFQALSVPMLLDATFLRVLYLYIVVLLEPNLLSLSRLMVLVVHVRCLSGLF